jgi:hypothetical protein
MNTITTQEIKSIACTNNFVYFVSSQHMGLLTCNSQDLRLNCLFDELENQSQVAADLESSLLYMRPWNSETVFVGNEQGEILRQFTPDIVFYNMFVSHNIILSYDSAALVFYTTDGDFITKVTDQLLFSPQRMSAFDVCIVYNHGIVVIKEKNKINLLRVV